ncbi:MAG: hypothetical protein PHF86_01535 [Candidatus Nanoarchaeia archaeon]|nr:hypothetical protein [Candidatus Nanoarchaeia archaeon]
MKAKLIKEVTNFERGKSPEEIKSMFSGRLTYDEILNLLIEDRIWEQTEMFVNDYIVDTVINKSTNFNIEDLKKVACKLISEALDNWYTSIGEELEEDES